MRRPLLLLAIFSLIGLSIISCGPGPYGFSRSYVHSEQEQQYANISRHFTYGAVTANPDDYEGKLISWFGVIDKMEPTRDGRHLIRFTHHTHKERHLCKTESDDSCRVTVNFASTGGFSAVLELRAEELVPSLDKIQTGTLMRVFGKVHCTENSDEEIICDRDNEGGVLLEGVHYRHWPRRHYVTTRSASHMTR